MDEEKCRWCQTEFTPTTKINEPYECKCLGCKQFDGVAYEYNEIVYYVYILGVQADIHNIIIKAWQ